MFLIRTLLSQGTILCIVLLLVTLDVGFSTAKATTKPGKLLLVLAGCLVLFGGMELLSRGGDPAGEITAVMFLGWLGLLGSLGTLASTSFPRCKGTVPEKPGAGGKDPAVSL